MIGAARRVLVVDNDADVRDAVCFILENAGFTVITAGSEAEAQKCLAAEIIHAAVIDVRLQDEQQHSDASGFRFAGRLPDHIPFIIFTGYENLQTVKTALGALGAKNVLSKKRPGAAAALKRYVEQLFREEVKVNFDLQIEGALEPAAVAARLEFPPSDPPCAPPGGPDVEQILRVLFRDASAIMLAPLLPPEQAPTVSQAGSVVVQVRPRLDHGWGAAKVVKFGAACEITQEAERYQKFKDYPNGQRLPRLDGAAYSRQLGGLTYSLLGSEGEEPLEVFAQFYAEAETADLTRALRWFFHNVLSSLYGNARVKQQDLAALYADSLGLTPAKLRNALQAFHPEALVERTLRFPGLAVSHPNPYLAMVRDDAFRPLSGATRECLCHGDLHARNILVDAERHFWLIDFARVGVSHALRDFAELESDIKFNLLRTTSLAHLLPLEQALLELAQDAFSPSPAAFGDAEIDKAYQVVVTLRSLAREIVQPAWDGREYDYALFMHTLNVLRLRHIPPAKKEHALLAAALLHDRLKVCTP